MIKTGINGGWNSANSCWQPTLTIFNSILNLLQRFNNLVLQGRCRFSSLTSSSKCLLLCSALPMRLEIVYCENKIIRSSTWIRLASAAVVLSLWTACFPRLYGATVRPGFMCLPYACESQRGVDWKHNPSQNPVGSTVINVQSLGGSPPSVLCLAGCCWWLQQPGGLPGLS